MTAPRVVTFGETMALATPDEIGSLAHISTLHLGIGGADSNVAVALSRLGVAATWVGRVGDDGAGERIVRELLGERIDVQAIVDPGAATGLMVKERRTAGTTRVIYYRAGSAGSRLSPDDLARGRIAEASLLHVTGITPALSESAAAATFAAIDEARAAGVPVSFDVNHRASLWAGRDAGEVYRRIAASSDIVFAGEEEARLVTSTGSDEEALLAGLAALGPAQVILKLGSRGSIALLDGETFRVPAHVLTPVDTVGAGDAFVGGYLADLVGGRNAADRLATATAAGAFACLSPGDWEGYPRRRELGLLDPSDPVIR